MSPRTQHLDNPGLGAVVRYVLRREEDRNLRRGSESRGPRREFQHNRHPSVVRSLRMKDPGHRVSIPYLLSLFLLGLLISLAGAVSYWEHILRP